jgi:formate-dependent nitrite reductase membrane component NrfD
MGVFSTIKSIFTGGAIKSIENIASEWIETDLESAEAKVLMVKTLDPNGKMRRDLSKAVTKMYKTYLYTSLALLFIEFVCAFFNLNVNTEALAVASSKLIELFLPITALFGTIVSASFGVNYANTKQNK